MTNKLPHQYEILFAKANSDVKIAKMAMHANDTGVDEATILFHMQQAAEKLIKALKIFAVYTKPAAKIIFFNSIFYIQKTPEPITLLQVIGNKQLPLTFQPLVAEQA